MNSEELELSLRAEFENYLNGVFGRLRQDVAEFQKNFEAEFAKHKAQMDEAIRDLNSRFEGPQFDKAFTESVTEHLRLARDEGAKLTATAMGEAAKLGGTDAHSQSRYDQLRDAINDISSRTSQSAILRSLVDHASAYTPRGAFFIVRNDRFVCWKVFGGGRSLDAAAPDVQFPASSETILADAARSLSTSEGAHGKFADDNVFLDALDLGRPDRMYAVPLTARGRGVAVLYADYGTDGFDVNIEAIETLVRVAGLTVELLAASQAARPQTAAQPESSRGGESPSQAPAAAPETPRFEFNTATLSPETLEKAEELRAYTGTVTIGETPREKGEENEQETKNQSFDSEAEADAAYGEQTGEEAPEHEDSAVHKAEPPAPAVEEYRFETDRAPQQDAPASDFAFSNARPFEPQAPETRSAGEPVFEHAGINGNGGAHSYQPTEPEVAEVPAPTVRSRFSERNLDLPIDVAEGERKLHNDARRFARLLVSEIKLYNEQQVNEARNSGDIYGRLREAIDRSREMYDNRVKPEVAAKFDYFHYELVNGLAEGNAAKLGSGYPGAAA